MSVKSICYRWIASSSTSHSVNTARHSVYSTIVILIFYFIVFCFAMPHFISQLWKIHHHNPNEIFTDAYLQTQNYNTFGAGIYSFGCIWNIHTHHTPISVLHTQNITVKFTTAPMQSNFYMYQWIITLNCCNFWTCLSHLSIEICFRCTLVFFFVQIW